MYLHECASSLIFDGSSHQAFCRKKDADGHIHGQQGILCVQNKQTRSTEGNFQLVGPCINFHLKLDDGVIPHQLHQISLLAVVLRLLVGLRSTLKDACGLEDHQASLLRVDYRCFVCFSPVGL